MMETRKATEVVGDMNSVGPLSTSPTSGVDEPTPGISPERIPNPPAFPNSRPYGVDGMELRDYFAAKVIASADVVWEHALVEDAARRAYAIADAMLRARVARPHDEKEV